MRIPIGTFLDPSRNGPFAVFAIAISFVVLAYSTIFGQVSILAYYALWLPLIALKPEVVLGRPRDLALPAAFAFLMFVSTFWSAAPGTTLRGSIQFTTHILCALVMARTASFRSITKGALIGVALVVLYSVLFGFSAFDVMDGSYTFVGAFGSKNQLGLYCSIGIFFAVIAVFVVPESRPVKIGAVLLGVWFMFVLNSSKSATSVIALVLALGVLAGVLALLRLSPSLRTFILFVALPVAGTLIVVALQLGAADSILALFGKDSTLTGRTDLWSIGISSFYAEPTLGIGYMAYWVQGFPAAEQLWHDFYIASRSGFHFHNTVIETLVELGVIGTTLLVLVFVVLLWRLLTRFVSGRDREAGCLLSLTVMLLVRSMSEVDVLYPYTIGSFLLFYLFTAAKRDSLLPTTAPPHFSLRHSGSTARARYARIGWS